MGLFARLGARGWQVEIQRGIDDVALVILACWLAE